MLGLTQPALAKSAGVGISTVVDFERERRDVAARSVEALRQALEDAGVVFIEENGGGVGVRLRDRA